MEGSAASEVEDESASSVTVAGASEVTKEPTGVTVVVAAGSSAPPEGDGTADKPQASAAAVKPLP